MTRDCHTGVRANPAADSKLDWDESNQDFVPLTLTAALIKNHEAYHNIITVPYLSLRSFPFFRPRHTNFSSRLGRS